MKIEGIQGDVTAKGKDFSGCFEIDSFSVGVSRHTSMVVGSNKNREYNTPQFQELSISKSMEGATADLFGLSLGNKGVKVEVFFVKTNEQGKADDVYLTYEFEDVLVSSYSMGASKHGDPQENMSFVYDVIKMIHTPLEKNNKKGSQNLQQGYSISDGERVTA